MDDQMIPPAAQRIMSKRAGSTVVEVKGSHAIYVSQPEAVAEFIKKAARAFRRSSSDHVDACRAPHAICRCRSFVLPIREDDERLPLSTKNVASCDSP
jgi:hypothetical protein